MVGPAITAGIVIGTTVSLILVLTFVMWLARKINIGSGAEYTAKATMHGKNVIITGATSGLGKAAAVDLAGRGARVIMACRNVEKARTVADEITHRTGKDNLVTHYLDTSKLASVRSFCKTILETEERIDVLILNAGIPGYNKYQATEDGIELCMATNHFGHFLMINLLLELMTKSAPSRIVVVSSQMHRLVRSVNLEKLTIPEEAFGRANPYGLSKACNVMTAAYLGPILQKHNVTINSMCPGLVKTEIFGKGDAWFTVNFMGFFVKYIAKTTTQGVATLLYLAVDEQVEEVTGKFFIDYKFGRCSALTKDANMQRNVWEKSEEIVGLSKEERSLLMQLKSL